MSNVLNEEKRQQVIALGRLQWSLRRIEEYSGVRRETVSAYLKAAGIPVRGPGRPGRQGATTPANKVTTDSGEKLSESLQPKSADPTPCASACEPYRESIELWLSRGRNATAI